ncbi:MAG: hypothetical protein AAF281_04505 [Pseudomonadota bacterium]
MIRACFVLVIVLMGCSSGVEIPTQRPDDFGAVRSVTDAGAGAFAVSGGAGAVSWCAAGQYAAGTQGAPGTARLERLGPISSAGLVLGLSEGGRTVPGPAMLYTTGAAEAFATSIGAGREARTVADAVAECA